ncbi:unnamed protein product [Ectocarpus sp. 4 AP-2014]
MKPPAGHRRRRLFALLLPLLLPLDTAVPPAALANKLFGCGPAHTSSLLVTPAPGSRRPVLSSRHARFCRRLGWFGRVGRRSRPHLRLRFASFRCLVLTVVSVWELTAAAAGDSGSGSGDLLVLRGRLIRTAGTGGSSCGLFLLGLHCRHLFERGRLFPLSGRGCGGCRGCGGGGSGSYLASGGALAGKAPGRTVPPAVEAVVTVATAAGATAAGATDGAAAAPVVHRPPPARGAGVRVRRVRV